MTRAKIAEGNLLFLYVPFFRRVKVGRYGKVVRVSEVDFEPTGFFLEAEAFEKGYGLIVSINWDGTSWQHPVYRY